MSTINVNRMVDSQGGVLAPISSVMRNRIINGDMRIDQRNAGASVSIPSGTAKFITDRFLCDNFAASAVYSAQQVTDAPDGFNNSLRVTVTTASATGSTEYQYIRQVIEGFNFADFMSGTANAKTFTLSFWAKSSITGTFGGYLGSAINARMRAFSYTINAANTWEYKTITIQADTSGTWNTTNGVGLQVAWSIACGSSYLGSTSSWVSSLVLGATGQVNLTATASATFQVTGVQLEKGTQATSFEYRQYGQELALCQRYYQTSYPSGVAVDSATGPTEGASFICINTSDSSNGGMLPVTMRATPTFAMYSTVGGAGSPSARNNASGASVTGITLVGSITTSLPRLSKTGGLSAVGTPYSAHYTASAEL